MAESGMISFDLIPEKNIEWEFGDKNRIFLLKEKSGNKFIKRVIDMCHKSQYFRIHFDETGTFVWNHINGKNSIKDLADILRNRGDGNEFPQASQRVERFIVMLLKNKFITIVKSKQGPE